jgi:hypothetical protein
MIITEDNVKCKRGQIMWIVAVTIQGIYTPYLVKAHSKSSAYSDHCLKVWSTIELCQEQCDRKNKLNDLAQTQ